MRRRLAAPRGGIVQHIVMQQRRRVQHFQRDGEIVDIFVVVAAQSGREHGQQRTQTLAARVEDVLGHGTHGFGQVPGGTIQGRVYGGKFQRKARFQK